MKSYRSFNDEVSLAPKFVIRCFVGQLLHELVSLDVNVLFVDPNIGGSYVSLEVFFSLRFLKIQIIKMFITVLDLPAFKLFLSSNFIASQGCHLWIEYQDRNLPGWPLLHEYFLLRFFYHTLYFEVYILYQLKINNHCEK